MLPFCLKLDWILSRVKLTYLKAHTSINSSAVLNEQLAIFSTFQLHFTPNRKLLLFSQPVKLPSEPTASQAVQGRFQKLKLTLVHGGFVSLLKGNEFIASGVVSRDMTFILLYLIKKCKAVSNFLKAHRIV